MTIEYEVGQAGRTSVTIHDAAGTKVRFLQDGRQGSGHYSLTWDGTDGTGRRVANGVYFCRLIANGSSTSRKLVLQQH